MQCASLVRYNHATTGETVDLVLLLQVEQILEDQTKTTAMVEDIEKFKDKVSKSLSMLTVKCEMLDKHVPELREKLEHAIYTINVRLLLLACCPMCALPC